MTIIWQVHTIISIYIQNSFGGVYGLRGLGKLQMKQRKKTENKIKNLLKRKDSTMNINEIIRATGIDPTGIIRAVDRLEKEKVLISYKHKNRRLVCWPSAKNRMNINSVKKEDEIMRRSQAQKEILIEKMAGVSKKQVKDAKKQKEAFKKAQERLDRIDREDFLVREMGKLDEQMRDEQMRQVLSVDDDKWGELWDKREKLFREYCEIV